MDKKTFREQQLISLHANPITSDQHEVEQILNYLFTSTEWLKSKTIATVISGAIEFPTSEIVNHARKNDKQIYLPKVMPKRQMAFLPFSKDTKLVKSKFGLLEPVYNQQLVNQNIDLLIVPGIAFTAGEHYRVGFGGGYYDRFLQSYSGLTVSLAPQSMIFGKDKWPVEDFDIPIKFLITKDGIERS